MSIEWDVIGVGFGSVSVCYNPKCPTSVMSMHSHVYIGTLATSPCKLVSRVLISELGSVFSNTKFNSSGVYFPAEQTDNFG